jgi:tripartite-type tricarboxylate transporter receptor subunit TctC
MTFRRRQFLKLAAGAAAVLPQAMRVARAQSYPARPVRIVVGYAPGGAQDVLARLIGQGLSERLGQPFVIENKPGAGGNIATELVTKAAPDGYTLLLVNTPDAINASLYGGKLSFNLVRDIAAVADVIHYPGIMVVNPALPAKTVPEFIAYTKANPGKVNMASAGNGSTGHISGELFNMLTGLKIVHVPFRGGAPALTALIGGQVEVFFGVIASSIEYVRTGKLRALAVTSAGRVRDFPDVPALAEFVPGYEASGWSGIGAPANTPAVIVDRLNSEINAVLADPKIKARLDKLGGTLAAGTPADFGRFIAAETEKWAKVIRAANIKMG